MAIHAGWEGIVEFSRVQLNLCETPSPLQGLSWHTADEYHSNRMPCGSKDPGRHQCPHAFHCGCCAFLYGSLFYRSIGNPGSPACQVHISRLPLPSCLHAPLSPRIWVSWNPSWFQTCCPDRVSQIGFQVCTTPHLTFSFSYSTDTL